MSAAEPIIRRDATVHARHDHGQQADHPHAHHPQAHHHHAHHGHAHHDHHHPAAPATQHPVRDVGSLLLLGVAPRLMLAGAGIAAVWALTLWALA